MVLTYETTSMADMMPYHQCLVWPVPVNYFCGRPDVQHTVSIMLRDACF